MGADISVNRKALHEYFILDRFEAGLELKGTEVKSIRAGHVNLSNAFARIEKGQAWLYDWTLSPTRRRATSSMRRSACVGC